ncbi:sensor histidine kinase [Gemmobacter serpentinus]|uniref:sensor histidine kinase n=1 Tax=Gemmobacter serpentinus TaxID=2652247 RepID=UPI00124F75E1|nr:HAMP domain-containing sensor histidine kinase [Gemmobacter serpentinus]
MRKWRPPLWFVLGGALGGTLALSLAGLVVLRYLGPEIGFRLAALLLAMLIGALTLLLLWLLVRLLLRPIRDLARFAAATRQGNTHLPAHFGTRELHQMGQSVIEMAGVLRNREATIRSFTDHVTHELKTPVTTLIAASELLEDGALSPEDLALVAQMKSAARQMETQLKSLRAMAAAREPGHFGQTCLADLLPDLVSDHPALALRAEGATQPLPLAATGLRLVLGHLLGNAQAHGARHVWLVAAPGQLIVSDDGRGISDGNRAHVFEPFFTTTRDTGGTGMGLSIVASLLAAHGAEIAVIPPPDGRTGAAFRLRFPD